MVLLCIAYLRNDYKTIYNNNNDCIFLLIQLLQEMELILDKEELFSKFQTDWLNKWIPAIISCSQSRHIDLSVDSALDGMVFMLFLLKHRYEHTHITVHFKQSIYAYEDIVDMVVQQIAFLSFICKKCNLYMLAICVPIMLALQVTFMTLLYLVVPNKIAVNC